MSQGIAGMLAIAAWLVIAVPVMLASLRPRFAQRSR
jgi:hypothetical protein